MIASECEIQKLVIHQMKSFWIDFDEEKIASIIPYAMKRTIEAIKANCFSKSLRSDNDIIFSPYHSDTWANFLYNLSHICYLKNNIREAEIVYYLNKTLHSNDWFYKVELPMHFWSAHTIGTVLGAAKYDDYFLVLQGCTVGGTHIALQNRSFPVFGKYVTMLANSTVLGDTVTGNRVIFAAGSFVKDENIPNDCIVFGQSPNLVIKQYSENEMIKRFLEFWRSPAIFKEE